MIKDELKRDVAIIKLFEQYKNETISSTTVINKLLELKLPLSEMSYIERLSKEYLFFKDNETSTINMKKEIDQCKTIYLQLMSHEGIPIKDKTFKQLIEYHLFELKHKYMLKDYDKIQDKEKFWNYVQYISDRI